MYVGRLLGPLCCVPERANVSPLYRTPAESTVYRCGPAQSSSSPFIELCAGLAHRPQNTGAAGGVGWGGTGLPAPGSGEGKDWKHVHRRGFPEGVTVKDTASRRLNISARKKIMYPGEPCRFSNSLLEDLKLLNAILEVSGIKMSLRCPL